MALSPFDLFKTYITQLLQGELLTLAMQKELITVLNLFHQYAYKTTISAQVSNFIQTNTPLLPTEKKDLLIELETLFTFLNKAEALFFLQEVAFLLFHYKVNSHPLKDKVLAFRRKIKLNMRQKQPINYNLDAIEQDCFNAIVPIYRPTDARNLAIAAYKNHNNPQQIDYIMRFNDPVNGWHSEELILQYFVANNLNTFNIMAWYSELQPCNDSNHTCRKKIALQSPYAMVNFSFNYDLNNTHLYEYDKFKNFVKSQKF